MEKWNVTLDYQSLFFKFITLHKSKNAIFRPNFGIKNPIPNWRKYTWAICQVFRLVYTSAVSHVVISLIFLGVKQGFLCEVTKLTFRNFFNPFSDYFFVDGKDLYKTGASVQRGHTRFADEATLTPAHGVNLRFSQISPLFFSYSKSSVHFYFQIYILYSNTYKFHRCVLFVWANELLKNKCWHYYQN